MALSLERLFETVVDTSLHPRAQIEIALEVMAHDGGMPPRRAKQRSHPTGLFHACINAATLALVDAAIPMVDYVSASTAGVVGSAPVLGKPDSAPSLTLDLSNVEELDIPWLTVACIGDTDRTVLLQVDTRINVDLLEPCLELALRGCHHIRKFLDQAVKASAREMLERRRE